MCALRDRSRQDLLLSGAHGVDEIMRAERLDALLFPAQTGALMSAGGLPHGDSFHSHDTNARHADSTEFGAKPAPVRVSFAGTACSEPPA